MRDESPAPRADLFGRFFLPGPTEVRREILEAQVGALIGHRTPEMEELMESLQFGLQELFRTERPVFVSASSATGLMEAAVRNGAGDRILCLVNGAFSERFARIGEACGLRVDRVEVPWGRCHDPDDLERRLRETRYDAVTVVHSETSTGALQPLEALSWVVHGFEETMFLVDSVSGVGGAPLHTDDWAVDFVLTGSQKAMALPPGLAFCVASDRMMERSASLPGKGVYFDLMEFQQRIARFQTPNTPALTLLYALHAQLKDMLDEGIEARWERHRRMARTCWEWVDRMREERRFDVQVLAPSGSRSPTVTCIHLPEGVRGPGVVRKMSERGFVIGSGYGKLKEETIRIGHMGDHTMAELSRLLRTLEEVLVG